MSKNIKVIINNFNRLTITKKLFEDIYNRGYPNIFIIDNQSTYPPLIKWYSDISDHVIYLDKNYGHRALWNCGLVKDFSSDEYIVYTDPDLELNENTPIDFIDDLVNISREYRVSKVGLAIKIGDLPDNELCRKIRSIETTYWQKEISSEDYKLYDAPIDTTFAIIKPEEDFHYNAIRVAGNYTCRHIPWYYNFKDLSQEELYIIDKSDPIISTYKQHYFKWMQGQPI